MKSYSSFVILTLALAACGQTAPETEQQNTASMSESSAASASMETPEASEAAAPIVTPDVPSLTAAKEAVMRWKAEMIREENFLVDAYKSGEVATLEKSSLDLLSRTGIPGGELWSNDSYAPFLKCESAWGDLGVYASAMHHDLQESRAISRKIVAKEKADYEASKALCEGQLKLSPEQAWNEYNKK